MFVFNVCICHAVFLGYDLSSFQCFHVADMDFTERKGHWLLIVIDDSIPLGTRRCCDVESTSLTLIQRRAHSGMRGGWAFAQRSLYQNCQDLSQIIVLFFSALDLHYTFYE